MSDDLVEFIKARLDEDEKLAHEAVDDDYNWLGDSSGIDQYAREPGTPVIFTSGFFSQGRRPYANPHIARHDPARVLAQVSAVRRLIDFYEGDWLPDYILAEFAGVWSDHPDYRAGWGDGSSADS